MNYLSLQLHKSEEVQEKVGFFVRVMFLWFLLVLPRYFSQNANAFFLFFFGSQLEGVRIAASKMSPMMETINMVNINIIVKCQFYMSGL